MKYYVYLLIDGDIPFYVGKGCGNRMYTHFRNSIKTKIKSPVLDKIRSMIDKNNDIIYIKIFESNDEIETLSKEILTIKDIGRRDIKTGPLLNLTDGGEGVINYIYTDSHKENLSKSIKKAIEEGRFHPGINNKGREGVQHTLDYKLNMSEKLKEYWESEKGQIQKVEYSEFGKSKLVNNKRVLSDEARKKISDAATLSNLKRSESLEYKLNMSEKLKKYWESEKGLLRKKKNK